MSRQDEVTRLHGEGMSPKEIAEAIGVSRRTVARDLKKMGLVQGVDREARNRRIVELYESGLNQSEVASEIGLTQAMVGRVLKGAGVSVHSRRMELDLSEAIRLITEEGLTHSDAAGRMGVSQSFFSKRLAESEFEVENKQRSRLYDVDDAFFESPNLVNCYWAGFFAADASLSKSKPLTTFRLSSRDEERVQALKASVGASNPVAAYENNQGHPYCGITITSRQWHVDLRRHFNVVPTKTSILQPPNLDDEDLIWAFCRGYVDGDGHVDADGSSIQVTTKSEDFITWMIRDVFGSHHSIYDHNGSKGCRVTGPVMREVATKLYADSTPETRMHRKYQRLVDGGVL